MLLVVWSKTWRAQLHCLLHAMHIAELANHAHMMVLLAAEGKIEGFHLHWQRKLDFSSIGEKKRMTAIVLVHRWPTDEQLIGRL